jgi:hypothetical protein
VFNNPENVFFVQSLAEPLHEGCRRQVATYDDGEAVYWVDVPYGTCDWEPMYLSTEAARIYMMSDAEFEAYEREELMKSLTPGDGGRLRSLVVVLAVLGIVSAVVVSFLGVIFHWSSVVYVVCLVLVFFCAGVMSYGLMRGAARSALAESSADASETVCRDFDEFSGDAMCMSYAHKCAGQVRRIDTYLCEADEAFGTLFTEGSLTWHRYHDTLRFAQERAHENARLMLWLLERSLSDKASEVIRDNERIIDSMSDLLSSMDEMRVSTRMSEASSSVSSVVDEISSLEDDLVLYR